MKLALAYIKNLDQRFWINHALASVLFFIFTGANNGFNLLAFPFAIGLLLFISTFYLDVEPWKKYLGFSHRHQDTLDLIITIFASFILWHMSGFILLFGLLFIWLKDTKRI